MEALEQEREERGSKRDPKQEVCVKMKGEGYLYIGGVPTYLSTKGAKKLNKKKKKSHNMHDSIKKANKMTWPKSI